MDNQPLGPEHDVFKKDVGTWNATVEIRLAPGGPVQSSVGTMVARLACGGRWLISDFKNETTGFEGHGIYTWDPSKKRYTGVWVDNARSSVVVASGTWDAAAKTMTMWSETERDGVKVRWREVTELKDADTQVFRSLVPMPDRTELEMMTVTYRRAKS